MLTEKEIREARRTFNETDRQLANLFKSIGDITRFRIIRILTAEPKASVTTIARILHLSTALTSQHIKVLVNARILKKKREGKKIFPKLDHGNPSVKELVPCVENLICSIRRTLKTKPHAALP